MAIEELTDCYLDARQALLNEASKAIYSQDEVRAKLDRINESRILLTEEGKTAYDDRLSIIEGSKFYKGIINGIPRHYAIAFVHPEVKPPAIDLNNDQYDNQFTFRAKIYLLEKLQQQPLALTLDQTRFLKEIISGETKDEYQVVEKARQVLDSPPPSMLKALLRASMAPEIYSRQWRLSHPQTKEKASQSPLEALILTTLKPKEIKALREIAEHDVDPNYKDLAGQILNDVEDVEEFGYRRADNHFVREYIIKSLFRTSRRPLPTELSFLKKVSVTDSNHRVRIAAFNALDHRIDDQMDVLTEYENRRLTATDHLFLKEVGWLNDPFLNSKIEKIYSQEKCGSLLEKAATIFLLPWIK